MSVKCKVCGRPIKHPDSIAAGMGPTCRGSANRSTSRKAKRARSANHSTPLAYAAHSPLAAGENLYLPISMTEWEGPDGLLISHDLLGEQLELLRA